MSRSGVVLFSVTSAVMRAEKILTGAGVTVKFAPVPRELSSDCGLALRFSWDQADRVRAVLAEAGIEAAGIHPIDGRVEGAVVGETPAQAREEGEAAGGLEATGAVAVAMSGGVDSAVAAALLLREGRRVVGVTLRYWSDAWPADRKRRNNRCCSLGAVADARAVADRLGIAHQVLACEAEFEREIIRPFVADYLAGRTPNPCVTCNAQLKFDWLRRQVGAWGATGLATGHYARVERDSVTGRYRLRRGLDPHKDQSYFLFRLTQTQLVGVHFPVGALSKTETRRIALDLGLPVAEKPESQEICFVGDDYRPFLRARGGEAIRSGHIRDTAGTVLGEHPGLAYFTVGQRHGLGLNSPHALYVIALVPERNEVIVGEERELWTRQIEVDRINDISSDSLRRPRSVLVQIRSTHRAVPATTTPLTPGHIRLDFDEAERAVAPGQAAVFYDREDPEIVLGGGTILPAAP